TDCEPALACERANEPACDRTCRREKLLASLAKSTSRLLDSAALTLVCVTDRLASVDESWFCTAPREDRVAFRSFNAESAMEMAVCAPSAVSTLRSANRLVPLLLRPTVPEFAVFTASTLSALRILFAFSVRSFERVTSAAVTKSLLSTVPALVLPISCVSTVPAFKVLPLLRIEPALRV